MDAATPDKKSSRVLQLVRFTTVDELICVWNRKSRAVASPRPGAAADAVTNDKCNDFCELARYRLAIAPFKRCCRAVEESVCPPLANPTATERIANTPFS